LKTVLENIPAHNFVTIAGDLNAQLGPNDAPFTSNKKTNRNGEKLLEFLEEFQLIPTNTKFMKPTKKLWSHKSPSGHLSQIDYILIRKKWQNSVRNSQSFDSFSSIGSDHRIVSSKICLSLRASKRPAPKPMKKIDWKNVVADKDLSSLYSISVKNRFDALTSSDDDNNLTYSNLVKSVEEVALEMLPQKPKRKSTPINAHKLVIDARKLVQQITSEKEKSTNKEHADKLRTALSDLDSAYLSAQAEYIQGKVSEISHLHVTKKHAAAWSAINELTGRKTDPPSQLKEVPHQKGRRTGFLTSRIY